MIANAERANAADEHVAVAGIPVPDQIACCPLPAARFRELIGDHSAVGCGDVEHHPRRFPHPSRTSTKSICRSLQFLHKLAWVGRASRLARCNPTGLLDWGS